MSGHNVGFCDGLYQGIEANWSTRMPSGADLNDVLPTNSVNDKPPKHRELTT